MRVFFLSFIKHKITLFGRWELMEGLLKNQQTNQSAYIFAQICGNNLYLSRIVAAYILCLDEGIRT